MKTISEKMSQFYANYLTQWFQTVGRGRKVGRGGVSVGSCGVVSSNLSNLVKSLIFRTAYISISWFISKTEIRTDFCEVHIISITIPILFLIYSFNRPCCKNTPAPEILKRCPVVLRLRQPRKTCLAVKTCQLKN